MVGNGDEPLAGFVKFFGALFLGIFRSRDLDRLLHHRAIFVYPLVVDTALCLCSALKVLQDGCNGLANGRRCAGE